MMQTSTQTSHQPVQPHENQTPAKAAKSDCIHELTCHLQRSVRYHKARERFFDSWANSISFVSLLAGSAVVVAILATAPTWVALASGGLVAAMQAIEQVTRLSTKARTHSGLAAEFLTVERILMMQDGMLESELRELKAEVLTIEAQEPPIKRYLDLICHNQVARSIGSDDIEALKWHQRWFAQWLNGDNAATS